MKLSRTPVALAVLVTTNCAVFQAVAQLQPASEQVESIVVQGQYLNSNAASAMKLDIPVRDTPFSVSSYSDAFLKSLETQSLQDTYNYMNGVKKAGQTAFDLNLRGFKTGGQDKNAIMVDGLPGLTARYSSPPTIGLDHVELVKGPMSVLYGQIQPGGFVNMITKKPKADASRVVDVRAQSYASNHPKFGQATGLTGSLDLTGPLTEDRKFLYRLITEVGSRDGFRDFTYEKGAYFAPSLTWNLAPTTYLNLAYEHRETQGSFDTGVVAPIVPGSAQSNPTTVGNVPVTQSFQEPGDYRKEIGDSVSGTFSHTFANDVAWNTQFRTVRSHSFQDEHSPTSNAVAGAGVTNIAAGDAYVVRRARRLATDRTYNFIDSNLTSSFDTGPVGHKVLLGANGGRDTILEDRQGFISGSGCTGTAGGLTAAQCSSMNLSITNPVYGRVSPAVATAAFGSTADAGNQTIQNYLSNSVGAYASDLLTFSPQWKLSAGLRTVWEKTVTRELRTRRTEYTSIAHKGLLPMVGVLFQPTEHWTTYTSYAESYVPAQAQYLNVTGQAGTFTPVSGKQVEVGAKAENLLDNRLNGSLAVFRIEKKNTLISVAAANQVAVFGRTCSVAAGESCYYQGGTEESRGVELELNGRLTDQWQTTFGYTYLDAKLKTSPLAGQSNSRLLNTPRNAANLWTRYDFASGMAKGVGVGFGLVYTGARAGTQRDSTNPIVMMLPSYVTADVAVSYTLDRTSFNVKVGNVFDRKYYESIGEGTNGINQIATGAGRLLTVSMRHAF